MSLSVRRWRLWRTRQGDVGCDRVCGAGDDRSEEVTAAEGRLAGLPWHRCVGEDDSHARGANEFGLLKLGGGIRKRGRKSLLEDEVSKRNGRSGDSWGGAGAGGIHGEPVLELLDAPEELASRRSGPATERTPAVSLLLMGDSTCAMLRRDAGKKQWLAVGCLNSVQCAARRG